MNFTLERYRAFPYVAWAVFLGFAVFVGLLAFNLNSTANELANNNQTLIKISNDNSVRLDVLEEELNRISNER